jgi:hypothetical protein
MPLLLVPEHIQGTQTTVIVQILSAGICERCGFLGSTPDLLDCVIIARVLHVCSGYGKVATLVQTDTCWLLLLL